MRLQFFVLDVVVNSIRLSDDNIYAQLKRIVQMAEERQAAGDVDHDEEESVDHVEGQTDRQAAGDVDHVEEESADHVERQTDRRRVTSTTLRKKALTTLRDRQTGGG